MKRSATRALAIANGIRTTQPDAFEKYENSLDDIGTGVMESGSAVARSYEAWGVGQSAMCRRTFEIQPSRKPNRQHDYARHKRCTSLYMKFKRLQGTPRPD